jgi:hypothetical protein
MEPDIFYANAFYIVAFLAIIIITTGLVLVFRDTIPLIRNLRAISEKIRRESDLLVDDVDSVRTSIHRVIKTLLKLFKKEKK